MKRPRSTRRRRRTQPTLPPGKVLLDQFHVEVYAPRGLSARKAKKIRTVVEHVLRGAESLIEQVAQMSARTKPGEIVVRTGDGT